MAAYGFDGARAESGATLVLMWSIVIALMGSTCGYDGFCVLASLQIVCTVHMTIYLPFCLMLCKHVTVH